MVPLKASIIAQKVADAYLRAADMSIMPAQRCVVLCAWERRLR